MGVSYGEPQSLDHETVIMELQEILKLMSNEIASLQIPTETPAIPVYNPD